MKFFGADRKLGVAAARRGYDLPLDRDAGTNFLKLLIALMTFLAVMALTGSFTLSAMTKRWSSGLENKLTIEIPAGKKDGELRSREEVAALAQKAAAELQNNPSINKTEILRDEDIQKLVEPWLGKDMSLADVPLPGLISVDLKDSTGATLQKIKDELQEISGDIVMDTHESWLQSLLRLTRSLSLAAMAVVIIITGTTITAIAGAIRSRIALHKADVELLHLMGAHDDYILRQFQRHALIIAAQGSIAGTAAGIGILLLIKMISGDSVNSFLPGMTINFLHALVILALPLIACGIATITTRFTVLRALAPMP